VRVTTVTSPITDDANSSVSRVKKSVRTAAIAAPGASTVFDIGERLARNEVRYRTVTLAEHEMTPHPSSTLALTSVTSRSPSASTTALRTSSVAVVVSSGSTITQPPYNPGMVKNTA
jgi:hypothetical protein